MNATKKTNPGKQWRETAGCAAEKAVERLIALLMDPDTSHGDVLKAAALIFERVLPAAAGGDSSDFEIVVKEE